MSRGRRIVSSWDLEAGFWNSNKWNVTDPDDSWCGCNRSWSVSVYFEWICQSSGSNAPCSILPMATQWNHRIHWHEQVGFPVLFPSASLLWLSSLLFSDWLNPFLFSDWVLFSSLTESSSLPVLVEDTRFTNKSVLPVTVSSMLHTVNWLGQSWRKKRQSKKLPRYLLWFFRFMSTFVSNLLPFFTERLIHWTTYSLNDCSLNDFFIESLFHWMAFSLNGFFTGWPVWQNQLMHLLIQGDGSRWTRWRREDVHETGEAFRLLPFSIPERGSRSIC